MGWNVELKLAVASAVFSVFALIAGFGLALGMDVRTKGEYVFVIVCLALCTVTLTFTVGLGVLTIKWARWPRVIASVILFGLICTGFVETLSWVSGRRAKAEVGFNVAFRAAYIDTSQSLNRRGFWFLYRSSYGDTLSPVALAVFADIASNYSHDISISNYSVSISADPCGWMYLSSIPTSDGKLVLIDQKVSDVAVFEVETLETQWQSPIKAYATQKGFLFFDSKTPCSISVGGVVKLKLELTDSTGKIFTFESEPMIVQENLTAGSSIGDPNRPTLRGVGLRADVSNAHRKLYSEAAPKNKPQVKGMVVLHPFGDAGKIIVLNDGAYALKPSTTPLW